MLVVFSSNCVTDKKITFGYNFVASLSIQSRITVLQLQLLLYLFEEEIL